MPELNIMEHIGTDGVFTETFKEQALTIAGDEFKDSKILDDIHNLPDLVKSHIHTKTAYGKKLEGVIQIPNENSSDEDRATATAAAQDFLGAAKDAKDYEFPRADGLEYDEEREKIFREFFMSKRTPVGFAKELVEIYNKMQIDQTNAHLATEKAENDTAFAELDKDWPGDSMVENGRTVFNAIMEFGTKDLQDLLKGGKINDDPGNHQKWLDLGFSAAQRRIWHNIGVKMKSAEPVPNEEGGTPTGSGKEKPLVGKDGIYNHPTSNELAVKK